MPPSNSFIEQQNGNLENIPLLLEKKGDLLGDYHLRMI